MNYFSDTAKAESKQPYNIDPQLLDDFLEDIPDHKIVSFILGRYSTRQIDKLCMNLAGLLLHDVSYEDQDQWKRCQIWKGDNAMSHDNRYARIYDDMAEAYEILVTRSCDGISSSLILAELTKIAATDS